VPSNRFFSAGPFDVGQEVILQGPEAHHLGVMRAKPNDAVELINGKGALAVARLLAADRREAHLRIESTTMETRPQERVILAQALPRMNHLEWIIEKGTELGVDAFWLFPGRLSEKDHLTRAQTDRLAHLICAASKQCGRLHFPVLELKPLIKEWATPHIPLLYGTLEPEAPYLWECAFPLPVSLCIGPEAGFAPDELFCLQHTLKGQGVRLSRQTLRTETAAIVGLSLLQAFYK
jgi:16S rRNA (uracil1498-N3)-methyltransferase